MHLNARTIQQLLLLEKEAGLVSRTRSYLSYVIQFYEKLWQGVNAVDQGVEDVILAIITEFSNELRGRTFSGGCRAFDGLSSSSPVDECGNTCRRHKSVYILEI